MSCNCLLIEKKKEKQNTWQKKPNKCLHLSGLYVCDAFYRVYKLSRAHDNIVITVTEEEECVTSYSLRGCVDKGIEKFRAGRLLLQVLDEASIELTFYFGYTQEILPVSKFCTFFLLCHNNNDVIMCS